MPDLSLIQGSGPQPPGRGPVTGGGSVGTGPWNYKMYTGGDTTRFLGMRLVDSSNGGTVA